jgi:hypothetical protein
MFGGVDCSGLCTDATSHHGRAIAALPSLAFLALERGDTVPSRTQSSHRYELRENPIVALRQWACYARVSAIDTLEDEEVTHFVSQTS